MRTVTSADGTRIAYDRIGAGPAIVFLPGAFNDRTACAPLAEHLADRYTAIVPDRRGRGHSDDAIGPSEVAGYEVRREIEDLDALLAAEGPATVFGYSSGAVLALHAAAAGSSITRLALYEPPFALGGLAGRGEPGLPERLASLIVARRPAEAVSTMQLEGIGLPAEVVQQIRQSPIWPELVKIAQTVVYDATITRFPNLPTSQMAELRTETLVLAGESSWPGLRTAAEALPARLHRARYASVPGGADHGIPAAPTARVLDAFIREATPCPEARASEPVDSSRARD